MADLQSLVSEFLYRVIEWGRRQPAISGVALVGSHARGEARPDSDIDLVLLCAEPQAFLSDPSWVRRFGDIESYQTEDWGRLTSLRVHYQMGVEVEFGMTSPAWAGLPVDPGTRNVVSNGMQILLDLEGALGRLRRAVAAS